MLKCISWNVNGLRACLKKGFAEAFSIPGRGSVLPPGDQAPGGPGGAGAAGYHQFWNYAEKRGYSGTAVFSRQEPLSVRYGLGIPEHDQEGRLITLEFPDYFFVCCYTPNAQGELKRIDYRLRWEDDLRTYLSDLDRRKPVIYAGDLNVAHNEIDLKNPRTNRGNPGFSDQERAKMTQLLAARLYRHLPHPVSGPHRRLLLVELPL